MHPLGPIAPEGANWMHFPSVAAALRQFNMESPSLAMLYSLTMPYNSDCRIVVSSTDASAEEGGAQKQ